MTAWALASLATESGEAEPRREGGGRGRKSGAGTGEVREAGPGPGVGRRQEGPRDWELGVGRRGSRPGVQEPGRGSGDGPGRRSKEVGALHNPDVRVPRRGPCPDARSAAGR